MNPALSTYLHDHLAGAVVIGEMLSKADKHDVPDKDFQPLFNGGGLQGRTLPVDPEPATIALFAVGGALVGLVVFKQVKAVRRVP